MTSTKDLANYLYFVVRGLVLFAFFLFLLNGDWIDAVNTAFIFLLMMLPTLLRHRYGMYLPVELELAIVSFIFLTLFLGSLQDYYEKFPIWDDVLHFQSGLLLGIVGFVVLYLLNERKSKKLEMSPGFISFFSVIFSMAVAVLWEIYEYTVDGLLGYSMQDGGLPDTMSDLIVNVIGALIVGLVAYLWMKRRKRLPFTPGLLKGYRRIRIRKR